MTSELSKKSIKLSLVVAMSNMNRGIGINGQIPWRLPKDMKHFAKVTSFTKNSNKMNAVIMGRLTWQSIPKQFRPLPNRLNIIISSVLQDVNDCGAKDGADLSKVLICKSFEDAFNVINNNFSDTIENIYAIGGAQIYKKSLEYPTPFLDRIYLTRVYTDVKCDVFMQPEDFLESFKKVEDVENDKENFNVEFNTMQKDEKSGLEYCFEVYQKM